MIFRTCSVCGHPMDPGEGKNGICDECLDRKEMEKYREIELSRMICCTDYKQMEIEELLSG